MAGGPIHVSDGVYEAQRFRKLRLTFPAFQRRARLLLSAAALAGSAQSSLAAGETRSYHVSRIFHIGGEGRWDYVTFNSERQLLFVPRTTHTMVLKADTGETVADIAGQKRNHGMALIPGAGRGFISDGAVGSVTVFDLKTYAALGKVKTAEDCDGIIYDPASGKVLVVCGDPGLLIPILPDLDLATGKADPPVELGGKPEFLAADGRGMAYINLVNKDEVATLDTKTMKVVSKWPTAPGGAPVGMSMDVVRRRLFIGCRRPRKLVVMDAADGDPTKTDASPMAMIHPRSGFAGGLEIPTEIPTLADGRIC